MQHVEKFRVFFYRSRDHGCGIMTSYLGSLVHKSLKLTKIMPNSLKLLDYYTLSNVPPKNVSRPLKEVRTHSYFQCAHPNSRLAIEILSISRWSLTPMNAAEISV